MGLLLSVPFLVLTMPALILMRRARLPLAGFVIAPSMPLLWLCWRLA
jgi:hypothetical protein